MIEIALKLLITFILSLLFGIERQKSHKPVGFGTFIFVSVGSCAVTIMALKIAPENPLPLLSSIITGVGFLGAGALIKTSDKIFGFTTAASIWFFAIFGLIIGAGQYYIAGIIYVSVWLIIFMDNFIRQRGIGSYQKKIEIKTKSGSNLKLDELLKKFNKIKMLSIEFDKDKSCETYNYLIQCDGKKLRKFVNYIEELNWIISYKIE